MHQLLHRLQTEALGAANQNARRPSMYRNRDRYKYVDTDTDRGKHVARGIDIEIDLKHRYRVLGWLFPAPREGREQRLHAALHDLFKAVGSLQLHKRHGVYL